MRSASTSSHGSAADARKWVGARIAVCAASLKVAGYQVGLYTSPHLLDYCERIQINGAPISHEQLVELVEGLSYQSESLLPGIILMLLSECLTVVIIIHYQWDLILKPAATSFNYIFLIQPA